MTGHRRDFRPRDPQLRVFFGGLAAWLFPSYAIPAGMLAYGVLAGQGSLTGIPEALPLWLLVLPISGVVFGFPTLVAGFAGWFLLHRLGLRGIGSASLLGALAPLASIGAISLFTVRYGGGVFSGDTGALFALGLVLLGAATGLLVRWVAYPAAERAAQTVDRTVRLPEDAAP